MRRILCICLLLLCLPLPAMAQAVAVDSVTLYPGSARVAGRVEADLEPAPDGLARAVFLLPLQADPESLSVSPAQGELADLAWKQVQAADQARAEALRARLDELAASRDGVAARLGSVDGRIGFWTRGAEARPGSVQDMEQVAQAMGRNLETLHKERSGLDRQLKDLERRIALAREELERATGGAQRAWQVEALLRGGGKRARLEYAYTLNDAGWTPLYRVHALPKDKRVRFTFAAEIRQGSGSDWTGADLSLATLRAGVELEPPALRPWVVGPRPEPRTLVPPKLMRLEAAPMAEVMVKAQAPVEENRATFALWHLGKRDLPSGEPRRVNVLEAAWEAEFLYTARPSQGPQAFLTARAKLDKARDLPPGQALFLADGAVLGRGPLSLSGDEAEFFFGPDPLVTAEMEQMTKLAGDKGFLNKKQTRAWEWRITTTNHKPYPVALRLEEPEPQPRHQDVAITLESKPMPEKDEGHMLFWALDLVPGQSQVVTHKVRITAPQDMDLDPGR